MVTSGPLTLTHICILQAKQKSSLPSLVLNLDESLDRHLFQTAPKSKLLTRSGNPQDNWQKPKMDMANMAWTRAGCSQNPTKGTAVGHVVQTDLFSVFCNYQLSSCKYSVTSANVSSHVVLSFTPPPPPHPSSLPFNPAVNELLTKAELIKADCSLSLSITQPTLPSLLPLPLLFLSLTKGWQRPD